MRSVILIAVMAVVTILLRFLPFLVFRKETPPYITYLGKVLPPAIIGLLVVALQAWKRNVLVSILAGTICYMALIHFVF